MSIWDSYKSFEHARECRWSLWRSLTSQRWRTYNRVHLCAYKRLIASSGLIKGIDTPFNRIVRFWINKAIKAVISLILNSCPGNWVISRAQNHQTDKYPQPGSTIPIKKCSVAWLSYNIVNHTDYLPNCILNSLRQKVHDLVNEVTHGSRITRLHLNELRAVCDTSTLIQVV